MLSAGKIANRSIDRQSYSHGSKYDHLPSLAAASQVAAAANNEGSIYYDETSNTVLVSDGETWAALTAAAGSLDAAFAVGAIIDGAVSAATAVQIGDASDKILFYGLGGSCYLTTNGSSDLVIAPDGGDVSLTGNLAVSGDMDVAGTLTAGTFVLDALDVSGSVTLDELILDSDGIAPAATNVYLVSDNSGDCTINAITGKEVHLAVAGSDEYDFSATILDMNGNALDNAGFIILNDATAPAATEVYAVNDNTGDLTVNAVSGKDINFAIAGVDEVRVSVNLLEILAGSDIQFLDDGAILDSSGNESIVIEATGSAINYLQVKNAATANPISLACLGTADKGFLFENDQDEVICAMTPVATGVNYVDIISAATGSSPIIRSSSEADLGLIVQNVAAEPIFEVSCGGTAAVNWVNCIAGDTGDQVIFQNDGEDDIGFLFNAKNGEEILSLKTAAIAVDYVEITACAADGSPTIKSNGSDTHIDLILGVKGTANVIVDQCGLAGGDGANENFVLQSTTHATKGRIVITDGDEGLGIGGVADRAGAVGDNALHIFDGAAAPAGALVNGISLYSEGGECKVLDATGNSTTLSPHTPDGDIVIHHYSPVKDETTTIHIEKLAKALSDEGYSEFVEVFKGHKHLITE